MFDHSFRHAEAGFIGIMIPQLREFICVMYRSCLVQPQNDSGRIFAFFRTNSCAGQSFKKTLPIKIEWQCFKISKKVDIR